MLDRFTVRWKKINKCICTVLCDTMQTNTILKITNRKIYTLVYKHKALLNNSLQIIEAIVYLQARQ